MTELGVFAADRGIFRHPLFDDGEPFSKREAWLWLIAEAAWKPRTVNRNGQIIDLGRGDVAHSVRFMATAWNWSKSRVDRFLDLLEREQMVARKTGTASGTGVLVLSVCNYDVYQHVGKPSGTASGTAAGQTRNIQTLTIPPNPPKGGKARGRDEGYQDDTHPLYADFLANVWAKRWKRKGHEPLTAYRAFRKLTADQREACKAAIARCARDIEASASEERFRPLLASWINKHGWEADLGAAAAETGPDWAAWVAAYRSRQLWNTGLGPEPGRPGCRVPREYLVEAVGSVG